MQAAKHVTDNQWKNVPAGKRSFSTCDPRAPRGVTGMHAPVTIEINKGVPLQHVESGGKTLPTIKLVPEVPNLYLSQTVGSGGNTLPTDPRSRTSISDTPPQADDRMLPTRLPHSDGGEAEKHHWQEVYNRSERNLVGALVHKAGQYKQRLDDRYDEEVGQVHREARAEVEHVHQHARHFAEAVVGEAQMYTLGIRAEAYRVLEAERQATVHAAEATIQQNKNEVVSEAQRVINHELSLIHI